MAKYTIELRKIIETIGEDTVKSWFTDWQLSDYLTAKEIQVIEDRGTFDKNKLAQLIVDHYYMREIGYETVALFKHQIKVAMREIMEEKAPLIYSAAISYDPLVNVDFTETYESDTTNNGQTNTSNNGQTNTTNTGSSSGSGLTVNSDTPQGQVTKANILAGNYASSTSANEGSNTTSNTGSVTNSDSSSVTNADAGHNEYSKRVKGNSGVSATAQRMVQQYRENIIMINRDIVKALESQFLNIF